MTSIAFGPILNAQRGKRHGTVESIPLQSASPVRYISFLEDLYTKWGEEITNSESLKRYFCVEQEKDALNCILEMDDNIPNWSRIFERVRTTTQNSTIQSIIGIAFPVSVGLFRDLTDPFETKGTPKGSTFKLIDRIDQKVYMGTEIRQRVASCYRLNFGAQRDKECLMLFVDSSSMMPTTSQVLVDDYYIFDPHILFIFRPAAISWS